LKLTYWLRLLTAAKQRPATIIQTAPAKGSACGRRSWDPDRKKVRRIITAIVCHAKGAEFDEPSLPRKCTDIKFFE
jgi:hypothetical protein